MSDRGPGGNMTSEELRELDRQVAEKVMGWQWAVEECEYPDLNHGRCRKPDGSIVLNFTPSTRIVPAWEVVEWLKENGYEPDIDGGEIHDRWRVECCVGPVAIEDTAPLAICKAALKAVETP